MKRSCLLGNMSLFLKVTIYNCLALCFPHFSQAICVERQGFSNCSFQLQNKYLLHNIVPQCLGAASIFPSSHVAIFIGHENNTQSHFPIYHAHICVYLYTISSSQQLCFDLKQTPHALPIPGKRELSNEGAALVMGQSPGLWARTEPPSRRQNEGFRNVYKGVHLPMAENSQLAVRNPPKIRIQRYNFSSLQENALNKMMTITVTPGNPIKMHRPCITVNLYILIKYSPRF